MNPAVYYELDNHAFSLGFSTYDLPTPKPITGKRIVCGNQNTANN